MSSVGGTALRYVTTLNEGYRPYPQRVMFRSGVFSAFRLSCF